MGQGKIEREGAKRGLFILKSADVADFETPSWGV